MSDCWNKISKVMPIPYRNIECPLVMARSNHDRIRRSPSKSTTKICSQNGAEGVMIKRPDCEYEDKRSDNMLKVKPVYDEERRHSRLHYCMDCSRKTRRICGTTLRNMDTYHVIDPDENTGYLYLVWMTKSANHTKKLILLEQS